MMSTPPTPIQNPVRTSKLTRVWDSGMLVDLTIRLGRLNARLEREDVGADERAENDIVNLGHKKLWSKEMLKPITKAVSHARGTYLTYTHPFPVGSARFVPIPSWVILEKELAEAKAEFDAATSAFLEAYDENKAKMLADYPATLTPSDYPSKDDMAEGFGMEWVPYTLDPAGDEANQKVQNAMDSFVKETVATLRLKVAEACGNAQDLIANNGKVTEKTFNSIKATIAQVRALNFVGDDVTENALKALEQKLAGTTARAVREDDVAKADFSRVLDLVTASVNDTSDADVYMGRTVSLE